MSLAPIAATYIYLHLGSSLAIEGAVRKYIEKEVL